ncbi:MAG: SMP-30/gluconolactonase/LRE family protein, partial [Gammaproteobacteria bacterium]|nr:SMP-30/gluconolactonase/LRE family protein [Gammaproteobacteria bacterium]
MKISTLTEHRCRLGEGPVWDADRQALYWVDSLGPGLYRYDFVTAQSDSWTLPGSQIGSVAVRGQGGLILAMDQGLHGFDPDTGSIETIAQPLAGRDGLRFNDGKVDPFGSFVAGGMNIDDRKIENCPMFRLTPELEVIEILDGF